MPDLARIRRESLRWTLLNTLNKVRPYATGEGFLADVARALYPDCTPHEIRRELDYLAARDLVELTKKPSGAWDADLTRYGIDVAEYAVTCDPGIARPLKTWDD